MVLIHMMAAEAAPLTAGIVWNVPDGSLSCLGGDGSKVDLS